MLGFGVKKEEDVANKATSSPRAPTIRDRKMTGRTLLDSGIKGVLLFTAVFSIIVLFFIIFFLFTNAYPVIDQYGIGNFFTNDHWLPAPHKEGATPVFGAQALIVGTILVTLGAMVFAIPIGIGTSVFVSQLAPGRFKDVLKTGIELLAGVPSVVYGLFGLIILVRWIKVGFDEPSGQSWLAGSILLGVMALPTIISVSEDAMTSILREQKEASLALGATKWQTIVNVIIPGSISGITAAVILGMGRAVGETMAVMMVTGNKAIIPDPLYDIFSGVKTLTGAIGIEMGEAGPEHQSALFFLGVLLFLIVTIINVVAIYIMGKIKARNLGQVKKRKKLIKLKFEVPDTVKEWARRMFIVILALIVFRLLSIWFGLVVGIILMAMIIVWMFSRELLKPKYYQWFGYSLVTICFLATITILGIILYYIFSEGMQIMSWEFVTSDPYYNPMGELEGGIWPAIVGTLYLIIGGILIATPLGVGAGIYLAEYAKESRFIKFIRLGIDNLNGTPSIVFGLFAFAFFVLGFDIMGWEFSLGKSLLTGILILSIMVLPTIIRTTEEALKSVPHSMREGSLALGSTKWETIWKVVLPPSVPGIITGIILSIGRIAGESAPILFTAATFITQRGPVEDLSEPSMFLSTHVFYASSEMPGGMDDASGTALVLVIMILIIYSLAAVARRRFQKKMKW